MFEKRARRRRLGRWVRGAAAIFCALAAASPAFAESPPQPPPQPPPLPPAQDAATRPVAPAQRYAVEGPYGPYSDLMPNTGQDTTSDSPFAQLPRSPYPYPYGAQAAAPAYPVHPYPSPPSYRPTYVPPPPPPQPAYAGYPRPVPSVPPRYTLAAQESPPAAAHAAPKQVAAAGQDGDDMESHYGAPALGFISEVDGGILRHDAGIFGRHKEPGWDIDGEVRFLPLDWLDFIASPRPHIGFHANMSGATNQVYAGLTWEFWFWKDFFINPSWGFSYNDDCCLDSGPPDTKQLGSHLLFREAVDVGWNFSGPHSVQILLDHVSQGHILASENEGMDSLGVRYGYRF